MVKLISSIKKIICGVLVAIFILSAIFTSFAVSGSEYPNAKFCPPRGKVLHIAGQTREDFVDYLENVSAYGSACGLPAGAAFYTSLSLNGIKRPWANVRGDHHQDLAYLLDVYEPLTLQIALWLGSTQLKSIPLGTYHFAISRLAENFKSIGRPIYFRIGYEFDGEHNAYDPREYKEAYKYIVDRFREFQVTNVAYVWHSYALEPTYGGYDVMEWYPGDEYVDWVGISFFQIVAGDGYYPGINRNRLLEIARSKQRPVMICESSALRWTPSQKAKSGQAYWDYWYAPFFEFIENNPDVKAFSIINCDWDSQKQFQSFGWGDARVSRDPVVLANWRQKMQDSRYLHSQPNLYEMLAGKTSGQGDIIFWIGFGVAGTVCGAIIASLLYMKRRRMKILPRTV